ncbi:MAG: LamG domain-containing protein [Spirochaetales bacterium]|nr:LamG domain-containing protein [Spirochaetales bacterium]
MYTTAQTIDDLQNASWNSFSSTISFVFDETKLVDGMLNLMIQVEDSEGNTSGIKNLFLACDAPRITNLSLANGTIYTSQDEVDFTGTVEDNGRILSYSVKLNGINRYKETFSSTWDFRKSASFDIPFNVANMADGDYTLVTEVIDYVGNVTTDERTFTVNKSSAATGYGVGTTWNADGSLIKDSGSIYLWGFNDSAAYGAEAGGNSAYSLSVTNTTTGAAGDAAQPSTSGNIDLNFPGDTLTIEYWAKFENTDSYSSVYLNKESVFSTNLYDNSSNPYASGNITLTTASGTESNGVESIVDSNIFDEWHHYAWVYNGSRFLMYIDGILVAQSESQSLPLNTSTDKLYIYAYTNNYMDEIRISSSARSGDELKAYVDYVKGLSGL